MLPATPLLEYDSARRGSPFLREFTELWRYRDLVRQLVARNIKVRYKRSVLGVAWSILSPLLQMAVLVLVFSSIFHTAAPAYPVYLFPGLLLWNFFAQTTSIMAAEVAGGADFWKRIYMPRTIFGVSTVMTGLVHLVLATVPLAGLLLVYRTPLGPSLIVVPFAVACAAMFALGVGLVVSALARYFPDIVDLYQVILTAWMYFTPVIYPREIVAERYRWLFDLNPMTHLVDNFRGPIYQHAFPSWHALVTGFGLALITLVAGWWLFTRTADDLPYQI
jgi:homopolymeric O-antigen transport system permease protein